MIKQNLPEGEKAKTGNSVLGVIDRFEGKFAIIKTNDGQKIQWPIAKLPDETAEGAAINLVVTTAKSEEREKERIAKAILNEILRTDEQNQKSVNGHQKLD